MELNLDKNYFIAHIRQSDDSTQSLDVHLSEVGELAEKFALKIELGHVGRLIGLLHDFGKYSEAFQNYIGSGSGRIDPDSDNFSDPNTNKGKIDHSSAGAQYVWSRLSPIGVAGQGRLCGQILALCIASHHSGLINCLDKAGNHKFKERMCKSDKQTHLKECLRKADATIRDRIEQLITENVVRNMFIKLREIVKDLPDGRGKQFAKLDAYKLGVLVRFLFSCLIDADRLNSAEFEDPERKYSRIEQGKWLDWNVAIHRLEQKLFDSTQVNPIDRIRMDISNECLHRACDEQGIYTLTVPTGGGKTLASLRYALHHAKHHDLDRIIYVVPYTSIIEQNAEVVRDIIEAPSDAFSWVLEHHSNLEPDSHTWRSKLVSENWDAPIVFTTMVQFLDVLFSGGTRSVRRMHQLANAVLVFDEIQALPIKCVHLFCNSLNFLADHTKTTAILCTATQPMLDRLPISDNGQIQLAKHHEIVSNKGKLFDSLNRVDVHEQCKPDGWSEAEIAEFALQKLALTGSCLVIVNTKKWARRLYLLCKTRLEDLDVIFYLTTDLYPVHRKRVLERIRERLDDNNGKPVLCISTQLIEAGVDISFASVIRFLAGLDSIAQAAGRCNRHGELRDDTENLVMGSLYVVNPDEGEKSIEGLPDIKEGIEVSKRILAECQSPDLLSPEVMDMYFDYYFHKRVNQMAYPIDGLRNDTLLNVLSINNKNPGRILDKGVPLLRQSFSDASKKFEAIETLTMPIVMQHGEGVEIVNQLCSLAKNFEASAYFQALKRAQQYSVNVFPNVVEKLKEAGAIHETQANEGIYYLETMYYSEELGLTTEVARDIESIVL